MIYAPKNFVNKDKDTVVLMRAKDVVSVEEMEKRWRRDGEEMEKREGKE